MAGRQWAMLREGGRNCQGLPNSLLASASTYPLWLGPGHANPSEPQEALEKSLLHSMARIGYGGTLQDETAGKERR